jgi:radial spoke head protein 1
MKVNIKKEYYLFSLLIKRRNGKGRYTYANGDKYEGDFRENKKHGIGKLTYKDKGEYYG